MKTADNIDLSSLPQKYHVAEKRNQLGLIDITDDEGNVCKRTKSIPAAAKWIIQEHAALDILSEQVGMTREDVDAMSVNDLKRELGVRLKEMREED